MLLAAQTAAESASAAADPGVAATISLGTQLGAAALLIVVMVLVHASGILAATKLLRLEDRTLRAHQVDVRAFGLLISIALCLFLLHLTEIALFALFYLAVGALETVESALYFSASAYTTLGHPDLDFPDDWRLLGALEGLVGFLLIGWSAAVFIADMNKVLRAEGVG
ncbi:MAG TPA: ion channel [Sphingomicrobium sp.]|nr:ion channel [Sphingomicrobium sp.]